MLLTWDIVFMEPLGSFLVDINDHGVFFSVTVVGWVAQGPLEFDSVLIFEID